MESFSHNGKLMPAKILFLPLPGQIISFGMVLENLKANNSGMVNPIKTAWLIGVYTNDIEYRIKRLGYKLTHYYPDLTFNKKGGPPPAMIVFSEDAFSDPH